MKVVRLTVQAAGMCGMLLIGSGCASFHVTSDPNLKGERGYKAIDTMVRRSSYGWSGPVKAQVGANEDGFTDIHITGSVPISGPNYSGTKYYGQAFTHKYADIEDVRVRLAFGAIFLFFLIDPTTESCVRLKYKDGTTEDISAFHFPMRIVPIWIAQPEWWRAYKGGKAFQSVVDDLKQDAAGTNRSDHM